MTPTQSAVGELLTGLMESLTSLRRSDLAHYSAEYDPSTKTLWVEGLAKESYFHYSFEILSNGSVGKWFVRPVKTVQVGYFFNSLYVALETFRNAK